MRIGHRGFAIRVAGDAAHGLLFTGYVLAEAALIDRRAVAHAPTLGLAARGPLSGGAIQIGGEPEEYPLVDEPDCLLLTSREALTVYAESLAPAGLLVVEESLTGPPDHAVPLPLIRTAVDSGGTPLLVDLVAAAVLAELTGAVSRRALEEAAGRLLPERGRPAGVAALEAGLELGKRRPRA